MPRPSFTVDQLRDLIAVDRHDLEDAAEKQPVLYQDVVEKYGIAYRRSLKASVDYDRMKGLLLPLVRREMEQNGEKVTDATAAAALQRHPDYVAAKMRRAETEADAEELKNLMFAYVQRGKSIDQLQSQLNGGFFQYRNR